MKLPLLNKNKEKTKVSQASGPFAEYLHAPFLDISKMHKEDNIQAIVSTPRHCLVLEKKEAREQLKRAVEFHEMFYQTADFLSKLQQGTTRHEQESIPITLKNFAFYFYLAALLLRKS